VVHRRYRPTISMVLGSGRRIPWGRCRSNGIVNAINLFFHDIGHHSWHHCHVYISNAYPDGINDEILYTIASLLIFHTTKSVKE